MTSVEPGHPSNDGKQLHLAFSDGNFCASVN